MPRQDMCAVRLVDGVGSVTFCAGQKYEISLAAGEVATRWADGSPITRSEFELVLGRENCFEIAPDAVREEQQ